MASWGSETCSSRAGNSCLFSIHKLFCLVSVLHFALFVCSPPPFFGDDGIALLAEESHCDGKGLAVAWKSWSTVDAVASLTVWVLLVLVTRHEFEPSGQGKCCCPRSYLYIPMHSCTMQLRVCVCVFCLLPSGFHCEQALSFTS